MSFWMSYKLSLFISASILSQIITPSNSIISCTLTNLFFLSRKSNQVTTRKTSLCMKPSEVITSGSKIDDQTKKLKNLKTFRGAADKTLGSWAESNGYSEKSFLKDMTDINRKDKALNLAYRRCEYVTKLFSKTFYTGTTLMRPEARKHVWAIYTWCRRTDDLVDSPRAYLLNREVLKEDLRAWEERLSEVWMQQPQDLFDLAMADTVKTYPALSLVPFQDMIKGMVMDIPGLGQDRYRNFDELYLYCYRVAGTVGLMTLPILGTAPGYTAEEATAPALALGIALQLTNILRDVGEDLERGRIYLPQDEIKAYGLTEEDFYDCEVTPKYVTFMQFQIERARAYYREAEKGIPMLAPDARLAVQASIDLYGRILNVIERNQYDNFNKRAYTTKLEKLSLIPFSFMKVNAAAAAARKPQQIRQGSIVP